MWAWQPLLAAAVLSAAIIPVFVEGITDVIVSDARNYAVVSIPREYAVASEARNSSVVSEPRNHSIVSRPRSYRVPYV